METTGPCPANDIVEVFTEDHGIMSYLKSGMVPSVLERRIILV